MASDNIPTITISSSNSSTDDLSSSSSSNTLPSSSRTKLSQTEDSESSSTVVPSSPEVQHEKNHPEASSSDEQVSKRPPLSTKASSSSNRGDASLPRTNSGPPLSVKHSKHSRGSKSASQGASDDNTPWHGVVLDHSPLKEQVVVFPSKMVHASPNIPYSNSCAFQRALVSSDLVGSGFVFVQVNGEKSRKNVKDNIYVFIVLDGTIEATIHQTPYVVSKGGVFLVPLGNDYAIRNISDKEAKLFFVQTRRPAAPGEGGIWRLERPSSKSFMLTYSLIQWLTTQITRLRAQGFAWYWQYLAKYRHYFSGRRLYFMCFLLGLIIRRLPFVGSPPILNIQLVRIR